MQLDWIEVFDLLNLTNRAGPFLFDPSLTWSYYEALGALVRGQDIDESQWEFLRRAISSLKHHDPFLRTYLDEAVIDGRIRTATKQWLDKGWTPKGPDRKNIQRLIFSAAPLSRVMLRHNRPLLEIYRDQGKLGANLAKREILPVPRIVFTTLEKKAYDELEAYCKDLTSQIAAHSYGDTVPVNLGFLLSFLRLRFASSLFAIRETLRRRREKVIATLVHLLETEELEMDVEDLAALIVEDEDLDDKVIETFLKHRSPEDLAWEKDRLTEMLLTLEDLSGTPSKMKELLSVLDKRRLPGGRIQQAVIFTRFYDTLQDIVKRLREIDPSMLIGRDIGCTVSAENETITLRGIGDFAGGIYMTVDQSLYDQGLPSMEGKLYFASYGDPAFEMVLNEFEHYELPGCVCRLTEQVPDTHAEVVTYAAACISESGLPQIRLITSWKDLTGQQLDETAQLSESDLSALKQNFHDIVRQEFAPARAVERLEKDNLRAGRAQLILDLLVIRRLLFPIGSAENDNFWAIVRDHLDPLIAERDQLIVPELPVETLREVGKIQQKA